MNGYFQLAVNQYGTCLCLYPPTEGGLPIEMRELQEYLQIKNVPFDLKEVNRVLMSLNEPTTVLLNPSSRYLDQELIFIKIEPDKMKALMRCYPPAVGGQLYNKDEIISLIKSNRIMFGIDEDEIEKYVANRQYCTDIPIAFGKEPVHGSDASIEHFFSTDLSVKPTLLEDGSVDFFNLNTLSLCKKGDILSRLYKEDPGERGSNVLGDIVLPREVKKARLQFGRNISISEDRTVLTSEVDGHVSLIGGTVFVSDIYEVENVDNSTGNIEFVGSVKISGNVGTNFTVKAEGNVEVNGVVEGAVIEAGGDIIIARGMNGMSKGILRAGGNVVSKFLENATVEAEGYIQTESILHSKVMAGTEVRVTGRKAFITGGVVRATNLVSVKTLGSQIGAATVVEVGIDPKLKTRHQQLQKDLIDAQKKINSIQPVLLSITQKVQQGIQLSGEQIKYVQSLNETLKQTQEQIQIDSQEVDKLQSMLEGSSNAHVIVTGEVFQGTKIAISDVSKVLRDTMQHCRFIKSKGDVMITSI